MSLHPVMSFSRSSLVARGGEPLALTTPTAAVQSNAGRVRKSLPALTATGFAVASVFKPLLAQAQGIQGLGNLSAASWIPSNGILLGGAALLAAGITAVGARKYFDHRQENEFKKLLDINPYSIGAVILHLSKIKNPTIYKKFIRLALEKVPLKDYFRLYNCSVLLSDHLTYDEKTKLLQDTFFPIVQRSSPEDIQCYAINSFTSYGFQWSDIEKFLYNMGVVPALESWQARAVANTWCHGVVFKKLLSVFASFAQHYYHHYPRQQLLEFRNFVEGLVKTAAIQCTFTSGQDFMREIHELLDLTKSVPELNVVDPFIMANLDYVRDWGSYFEDHVALFHLCRNSETRHKIFNHVNPYMTKPEDYFIFMETPAGTEFSFSSWSDYADWLAANLPDFFAKNPSLQEIHKMNSILGARVKKNPVRAGENSWGEEASQYFHVASCWAMVLGYVPSVEEYFKLLHGLETVSWEVKGQPGVSTVRFYAGTKQPPDFAAQSIRYFVNLKPNISEVESYLKFFEPGKKRSQILIKLAQLGFGFSVQDYIRFTDPEFLFDRPSAANSPAQNMRQYVHILQLNEGEKDDLAQIYFKYFKPLIVELANSPETRAEYENLRAQYLRGDPLLVGFVTALEMSEAAA